MNQDSYYNKELSGDYPPCFSSIIICGIVRNAEKGLRRNIPVIDKFCKLFRAWKIVIYENDSVDDTKQLLYKWHDSNPSKITIISEDVNAPIPIPEQITKAGVNPFFSNKRISKMAYLRNKYLDQVERSDFIPEYLMVVDLDVSLIFLEGLWDSMMKSNEWDAVCAFGYSTSPSFKCRYHDTYALCEKNASKIPQTENMIQLFADIYAKKCKKDNKLIPVDSAFGGLAIYKYAAIKGLRYKVIPNNDKKVEVRCEHFSLNRQMSERGFNRIFINPRMKLKYQSLDLNFLLKKIKKLIFDKLDLG